MDFQSFADNFSDGESGVEGAKGVLKNHLHLAPQGAELSLGKRKNLSPVKLHASGGGRDEFENRATDGRLPASTLTHEADSLTCLDGKRNIIHGTDVTHLASEYAALYGEPCAKILNLEQRHRRS